MISLLYIYITIFTLYYILLALLSLNPPRKVRDKYVNQEAKLCVVVYASGEVKTLDNLIKQLKYQQYSQNNYTIYAILDKCENEIMLQNDLDVNVININNLEPIGKSQAYSILAERLSEVEGIDAYVFLDAKNYVNSDFLHNVNYYLTKHDVFIPMINYIFEEKDKSFWENVKFIYSRYCSKFIFANRSRLGLMNLINSDSFVIRKQVLDSIGTFDFKDKISEVKYTLELAKEGRKVAFLEDLPVYTAIENYDSRVPSLSQRFSIFWNNIMHPSNFVTKEYLCSLIQPNWLTCVIAYAILIAHSYTMPFWVSYQTILITSIIFILSFCISLLNAKIYGKEYLYLFAYPIHSLGHITLNFPPLRGMINLVKKSNHKPNIEKMVTNIIVTDGKQDFQCQLELISDDGLARVKFINKGKTYTTKNNHLRMVDAIKELTSKLADYGLSLKVCQCCKYFQPVVDGTTNMVKGCCACQFQGRVEGDVIPTLVWNTCPRFEEQNVVNLF